MNNEILFETLDIDWFFVDINFNISHVASGGGNPPHSIIDAYEKYSKVQDFFNSLPQISEEIYINNEIESYLSFDSKEQKEKYLDSFVSYAKKGLFSFDKTYLSQKENNFYHLVAYPKFKLDVSLIPLEIKKILCETFLNGDISNNKNITIDKIK